MDGHFGCFHILAVINYVAINSIVWYIYNIRIGYNIIIYIIYVLGT